MRLNLVFILFGFLSFEVFAATGYDLIKSPPSVNQCDRAAVQKSLSNSQSKANLIRNGVSPSGTIGAATFRSNSCEGNICTPLPEEDSKFNPEISPNVTDACVRHCVLVHEWFHFKDTRPWRIDAPDIELVTFWELPAYLAEAKCLQNFLRNNN